MTFDTTTMILIVCFTAAIVHVLHLTFPSNKTVTKIDTVGQLIIDELRRLFPQVTVPPSTQTQRPTVSELETMLQNGQKVEITPSGEIKTQSTTVLASAATKVAPLAILLAVGLSFGCGASARQDTLRAAIATVTGTEQAMIAYDKVHQTEIASDTKLTPEQRHEALTAYRATRDKAEIVVDAAWRALGIAGPLSDDLSLAGVKQALIDLAIAFQSMTGGKP